MAVSRAFSIRWLVAAMSTLAGASLIALVVGFWVPQDSATLGLLAIACGTSALLLGRAADRPVVREIGVAAAVVAGSLFAADAVIPGLPFIDVPGHSLTWIAIYATTLFAFATLGGRLGSRVRGQLGDAGWVSQAFVLAFIIHGVFGAWVFGLACIIKMGFHGDLFQLAGLALPCAAGVVIQLAYRKVLGVWVFVLGSLLAALPTTALALSEGDAVATKVTVFVCGVVLGSVMSFFGARATDYLKQPQQPETTAVPIARAR